MVKDGPVTLDPKIDKLHWHTAHLALLALHKARADNNHQNGTKLEDFLAGTPGLIDQFWARLWHRIGIEGGLPDITKELV